MREDIHYTKRDFRTVKKRGDRHLQMARLPDQPAPGYVPLGMVIRYTMFNTSKTYKPNGKRECERRRKQMDRIQAKQGFIGPIQISYGTYEGIRFIREAAQ